MLLYNLPYSSFNKKYLPSLSVKFHSELLKSLSEIQAIFLLSSLADTLPKKSTGYYFSFWYKYVDHY